VAWPPRWPIQVCGWRAQCPGWWAHRLLLMGAGGSSFPFCPVGLGWPTPVHGFGVRERHDEASVVWNGHGKDAFGCAAESWLCVCPAKGRVDSVHSDVCLLEWP
jgi:hypothetical protein